MVFRAYNPHTHGLTSVHVSVDTVDTILVSSTLSSESAVKCIAQFNDSESLAMPGDRIAVVQHFKTS